VLRHLPEHQLVQPPGPRRQLVLPPRPPELDVLRLERLVSALLLPVSEPRREPRASTYCSARAARQPTSAALR